MKNQLRIISVVEIVVSLSLVPLWFINIFCDVGYLPNQSGDIVEVKFYHSMFENISDLGCSFLAYISIAFLVCSAVLSLIRFVKAEKGYTVTSHIVFGVAILFFVVLLLVSSSVARGY